MPFNEETKQQLDVLVSQWAHAESYLANGLARAVYTKTRAKLSDDTEYQLGLQKYKGTWRICVRLYEDEETYTVRPSDEWSVDIRLKAVDLLPTLHEAVEADSQLFQDDLLSTLSKMRAYGFPGDS